MLKAFDSQGRNIAESSWFGLGLISGMYNGLAYYPKVWHEGLPAVVGFTKRGPNVIESHYDKWAADVKRLLLMGGQASKEEVDKGEVAIPSLDPEGKLEYHFKYDNQGRPIKKSWFGQLWPQQSPETFMPSQEDLYNYEKFCTFTMSS